MADIDYEMGDAEGDMCLAARKEGVEAERARILAIIEKGEWWVLDRAKTIDYLKSLIESGK